MALVSPAPGIGTNPARFSPQAPFGVRRRLAALGVVLGMHGLGLWLALHIKADVPVAWPSKVVQVSRVEGDSLSSGTEAASAAPPSGTQAASPPQEPPATPHPKPAAKAVPMAREASRKPAASLSGKTRVKAPRLSVLSSPASSSRPIPTDGGGEASADTQSRSETVPAARNESGNSAALKDGPAGSDGSASSPAPSARAASTGGGGSAPGGAPGYSAPRFDAAYLSNPAPEYPSISREMGEEGRVFLRVQVSTEGKPLAIGVHRSSGYDRLDEAALAAVRRWRFVPGRLGAQPVAA
jgi:protein TonB